MESFPVMILSLLDGGPVFAGKSGRDTANTCETSAIETDVITAAHFMICGLIKTEKPGKNIFAEVARQISAH